ncbi:MAG: hypothetical protein WDO24_26260 [Pseudomonadota bacterium]
MTYKTEIKRRYDSRDDAWGYLASRGFVCRSSGWQNGRWAATVVRDGDGFDVTVWLRAPVPVSQAA